MNGILDWLQTYYGVIIAIVAVLEGIACFIWLGVHGKKGHKVPDAVKIEQKKKKQELKAAYKVAVRALEREKQDEKKK